MSLALWTATSIAAVEQRVFDLLDEQTLGAGLAERPGLQPIAVRLDGDDLDLRAGLLEAASPTVLACHSARRLPRVPIRIGGAHERGALLAGAGVGSGFARCSSAAEPEQAGSAPRRRPRGRLVADRLQLFGRREQQLLDDQPGDLVDAGAGFRWQAGELGLEPQQLGLADASKRWRSATTVGMTLARLHPGHEPGHFVGDDRLGTRQLAGRVAPGSP